MTQFKAVDVPEAEAAKLKAAQDKTTTSEQYKALLLAALNANELQGIIDARKKEGRERDVNERQAWDEFSRIVEENKSGGRRGYSRTQMGFEDSMFELAVSCVAMGRALAYTSVGSAMAALLDLTEEEKQKWETRSAQTAQFGAKALRLFGGGVLALAGIVITAPEALFRKVEGPDQRHLYEILMGIKKDIPRVEYRVIFDSTGAVSRQLIIQDSAGIPADQMKQHEAFFDSEFLDWLDLEHGYKFTHDPAHPDPHYPKGAFINPAAGLKLDTAEYNRLNSIPGKSLSEFIEHRTQLHAKQLDALPEETPRPRL